jgi:hypothetical protein
MAWNISCNIKFHRGVSLLKIPALSVNIQFYSLQNSSYFIILYYIELKIDMFSWSWHILRSKCPKCPDTGECLLTDLLTYLLTHSLTHSMEQSL